MNIVLLGASGSIGSQTLDIIIKNQKKWVLTGFSVGKRVKTIDNILSSFNNVKYICVRFKSDAVTYKKKYPGIKFFYGDKGLIKLLNITKKDCVLNALVGFAGVKPSLVTLKHNRTLLLANKESLVVAGELINKLLEGGKGKLVPIDSEHVAIAKCLFNEDINNVKEITITASGGPFYNLSREELVNVTKKDALNHPTWKMGEKITIDSATMMNKTFELIEAHYLYRLPSNKIKAVVDRNSKVHGFVSFNDGHVNLNVSKNTMEYPIRYALNLGIPENQTNFEDVERDTFDKYKFLSLSKERFPLLNYADLIIEKHGNLGCVLNAINEELVYAFLNNEIKFVDIEFIIDKIMKDVSYRDIKSYKDLKRTDCKYRKIVRDLLVRK